MDFDEEISSETIRVGRQDVERELSSVEDMLAEIERIRDETVAGLTKGGKVGDAKWVATVERCRLLRNEIKARGKLPPKVKSKMAKAAKHEANVTSKAVAHAFMYGGSGVNA